MDSVPEVWKDIKGFEGKYQVSNLGNVKSLDRMVPHPMKGETFKRGAPLKPSKHSGGYLVVGLGGPKHYVHRLVMQAFVGDAPEGMKDVNHISGDKTDNRLSNLEYCTRLHNVHHAWRTGLQDNAGENNGGNKYTEQQVRHGYALVKSGMGYKQAASMCGVSRDLLEAACRGERWKSLGLEPIRRNAT